jgi:hypothetical protein
LIYSIGLTDYFNDKFVIKLLNWIHGRLRGGGHTCNFRQITIARVMDYVLGRLFTDLKKRFTGCLRLLAVRARINLKRRNEFPAHCIRSKTIWEVA